MTFVYPVCTYLHIDFHLKVGLNLVFKQCLWKDLRCVDTTYICNGFFCVCRVTFECDVLQQWVSIPYLP